MCDKRAESQQQGYCGFCRVLYRDLNQHLSSLKHLDAVRSANIGASPDSSHCHSQSGHSLLERFLQDVIKHHPRSYDNSPSDAGPSGQDPSLQKVDPVLLQQQEETTPPPSQAPPPVHRKHRPQQVAWSTWQRIRRRQQSSSEHSNSTIEGVIRHYCYDQDDDNTSDSVHFSLPISMEMQTDEWDAELQICPTSANLPCAQTDSLLEAQVDLDLDYSQQLDWALEGGGGGVTRGGFLEQPIDMVLPAPQFIPFSFRGKSWRQIEEEDEARVLKLVRQFRTGVRTCYFDSESLARYGSRSYKNKEEEPDMLPLLDQEAEWEHRRRRGFRLASRCQVVKLSRATQTLRAPCPARAPTPEHLPPIASPSEAPLPEDASSNQQLLLSGAFPAKYSSVLSQVQCQTSVLYLLCCPWGQADHQPDPTPSPSLRRRRRLACPPGSKVTYRRLPLTTVTVKPFAAKPFAVKPRCVRQLFRSLSPELNTGPALKPSPQRCTVPASRRRPATVPATAPRREGLRSRRPQR